MSGSEQQSSVSLTETLKSLRDVVSYRPVLTISIVGLNLLLAGLEGFGLGFILPVITVVQGGSNVDPSGPVRIFVELYDALGIPFTLEYIVGGVTVVIGARYAIGILVAWLAAILGAGYRRHLRINGFNRALKARTAYFDEYGSEKLLNAILTQTGYASQIIMKIVRILKTSLVILAYVLISLYLAPGLMVLTGVFLFIFMFGSKYLFESGYEVGDRLAQANERLQESLQAGIQGIREVKLFSLRDELSGDFQDAVDRQTEASIKQQRDQTALANLNNFFASTMVFVLVYLGVSSSSLSLPSLGVFLFAMFRLAPQVSSLNGLVYDLTNDLPHLFRTQAFISRLGDNQEDWGEDSVSVPVEKVEFRAVDFAYPSGDEKVIRDISFSVQRGEFAAFVGPSGAGKSTIVSLLAGLYQPNSGQVLADSTPIHHFQADEWRSRVAVVKQDPHVFNQTLRYNVTIGNRKASDAAIERACEIAQVTEFLPKLPNGYDTILGDDGVRLSGGQRQRLAIARALLKDADLLVLDEATSELDSHLEARVHAGIEELDNDYTVVAIAHRLSTVTAADAIYVVEEGNIVESGTHNELLEEGGKYSALFEAQIGQSVSTSLGPSD